MEVNCIFKALNLTSSLQPLSHQYLKRYLNLSIFDNLNAARGGWEPEVGGKVEISCCARWRIFTGIGEVGQCCVQHFRHSQQHDSSPPLTSSGLGSHWRFSKSMQGVSEVCGAFDVDKVFVSSMKQ